jgi:UDP-glucose 4-epimerase
LKLLISGSRGFIGSSVGEFASRAGHEVLGLGRASQPARDWSGDYKQLDVATSDLASLIETFKPDAILHAAGTASVGASLAAPLDDLRAAMLTWANMLDGVRRSGLRPLLIFPSSAAVYGAATELPINEDAAISPLSPYGFHKVACELLAKEYAECFGLRTVVCRLFSVFGPRQRRLFMWEMYKQATDQSDAITLGGSGEETRDYLHVEDVAAAMLSLIEKLEQESTSGGYQIFNIGSGVERNVLELAKQIRDVAGSKKPIVSLGQLRSGDPKNWRADTSRLRALIPGWQPGDFDQRLSSCLKTWEGVTRYSGDAGQD